MSNSLRDEVEALLKFAKDNDESWRHNWHNYYATELAGILARHPTADGVFVPESATISQSSGLARDIVFWWGASNKHGAALHEHLRMCGTPVPTWLHSEIPNEPHTPPKGAVAAVIYRAMVEQHQADAILAQRAEG